MTDLGMNERAYVLANSCIARADELRIAVRTLASGARVVDAGVEVPGGFAAGLALAELCMGGLGHVEFTSLTIGGESWPGVQGVDRPSGRVLHGVAVRRAGRSTPRGSSRWAPDRCARRRESRRSCSQSWATPRTPRAACWCSRGERSPPTTVAAWVAGQGRRLAAEALTFAVAPTASLAGGVQIVARVLETGLAQDGNARIRRDARRQRDGHGAAAADRRKATCARSAAPTTAFFTAVRRAMSCGPTTTSWPRSPSASRRPPPPTTARPSTTSSSATTTTSIRSIRCSSARPKSG